MRDKQPNERDLNEIDPDQTYTVSELLMRLTAVKNKYGAKSIIRFDAGYNNISAYVTPSKKVKS